MTRPFRSVAVDGRKQTISPIDGSAPARPAGSSEGVGGYHASVRSAAAGGSDRRRRIRI